MTTIAYRDGVMAADSGVWNGDACSAWARKLAKGSDGTLYGIAGNAAQGTTFLKWVDGGCRGEQPIPERTGEDGSSFVVLAVSKGGPVRIITARGDEEYDAPYFSIGGGAATAYGALFVGASAKDAIAAAVEHGCSAHGKIITVSHAEELSYSPGSIRYVDA